jgi:isopropylmalate/homocitrate/citramalate synthase
MSCVSLRPVMRSDIADLLSTWNEPVAPKLLEIEIEDDSLRDGLQGAFVRRPSLAEKIELLTLASQIGVHGAMLGFPASSAHELEDCVALVEAIAERGIGLTPRFLARARVSDLEAILEVGRRTGRAVGADFFIGTSTLRRRVEGWDFEALLDGLTTAAAFMQSRGAPFSITVEDATRTPPDDLRRVVERILELGSTCVAIADTVGDATPAGAQRIVRFVRAIIDQRRPGVGLLWHGHNDRGLALANSLAAAEAGATIIGGSFLGIGERTGNAALEQVIVFLAQHGATGYRVDLLPAYCALLSRYTGVPIPDNAPLVGAQAFSTCTGTHAAAILKARSIGIEHEDYVFSSVSASQLGRIQDIQIGPTSGLANARYMLERLGLPASPEQAERLLALAKSRDRFLRTEEIVALSGDRAQGP